MSDRKGTSGLLLGIPLALGLMPFAGCGEKYTAFRVTSDPPGASVDSLINNKISGGTFVNASLGTTPTELKTVHFAFGAPGVGDTKIGIRVHMPGYKAQELFFGSSDWHETVEGALSRVREISVVLEPEAPSESEADLTEELPQEPGTHLGSQTEPPREPSFEPSPLAKLTQRPQPASESDKRPKGGGQKDARTLDAGKFQCKVPATWTRAPKSEEDELKRMMLAGARQMLDTSKAPLKFDRFYAFQTPGEALVLICDVPVPEAMSARNYLFKMRTMNETKFEYGRQQGIVKRVMKIKLSEVEGTSVLETEYVATQGRNNRTLIYSVASGPSPKFAVTISAFFPENDDRVRERVKTVMESVVSSR